MEVSSPVNQSAENWSEQFAAALQVQRQRVREYLSAQQERIHRAEAELSGQLHQIAVELADDRRQTLQAREELTHRSEQLQRQSEALEEMKKDLSARQAEWEILYHRVVEQQQTFAEQLKLQQDEFARRQQDLLQQQTAVVAADTRLMHEKKELETGRAELENQRGEILAFRDSLQTRQNELDKYQQELIARSAETESRRRSIARELKAMRAAHLEELDRKRIELDRVEKADSGELQRQLESLQEECRILRNNPSPAGNNVDRQELERIVAEKNELAARLADLEKQLAETRQQLADAQAKRGEDRNDSDEDDDSYSRRYEMAVDDLHELKAQNEELQRQLVQLRQNGAGTAAQISSGVLNWEAEKQRILASLEDDFDDEKEEDREEKLKIQDVIRKTDRVVAEKIREIGELRELLESQTNNIGSMAVGAAALGHVLDNDAIIQEERKILARLQAEWRDKLRQAEVEISLERAKIARERSQLEEKLRVLKQQGIDLTAIVEEKEPPKPTRGRWLAQLGLADSENDPTV